MKKVITLLILAVLLIAGNSYAAVGPMLFSQSTGTYTELAGGTVALSGDALDDNVASGVPIGFTFNFNGTAFTTLTISNNGYILFGYNSSIGISSVINSSTTWSTGGVVSALGRDLYGMASTEVRYQTLGSAPNQIFVIQWKNATNSGDADNFNFQIRLHQTTNKVEIMYGSMMTVSTSNTCQVGLRGASTNTDFNNRTTTSSWAATTQGSSNSSNCSITTTVYPASGLTFSYLPPQPAGLTATPVSTEQIDVTWTATADQIVLVYNTTGVFTTPSGAPTIGSTVGGGTVLYYGNTVPVNHTGLTANTTYYYKAWVFDGVNYTFGNYTSAKTFCPASFNVPYLENFEGITADMQLGCFSFSSTPSTSGSCRTYVSGYSSWNFGPYSGTKHGGFYASTSTGYSLNNWFYSPALNLQPGTYKVSIMFRKYSTYAWSNVELRAGSAANATAMASGTSIAQVTIPSGSIPQWNTYSKLAGLLTVTTAGTYYIGFNGVAPSTAYGLAFDDLSVVEYVAPSCLAAPTSPATAATGIVRNPSISWPVNDLADSYDVYFGSTNPPALVGNQVGTTYTPGLLDPNTTYYWKIVPKNVMGEPSGCPVWSFTTGTGFQYCTANVTSTGDEDIYNVTLGTINNTSATLGVLYTDYTNISTDLLQTFNYPISITYADAEGQYFYNAGMAVFIDWNQNGVFDIPGETVFTGPVPTGTAQQYYTWSGNITVPITAVEGPTRMRVVLTESYLPTVACNPLPSSYGEVEDYTVNVIPFNKELQMLTMNVPSGCNLTNAEPVSVTYRNNALQAQNNYTLSYFNGTAWVDEVVTTTINPGQTLNYTFATPVDLSAFGVYTLSAKVTLTGDVIPANNEITGVKARNYPTVAISDDPLLPYTENFDGAESYWFADGMNNDFVLGTPAKTHLNAAASAPNSWVTKTTGDYSANQVSWVESPCFDLTLTTNPLVQFDIKYQTEQTWDGAVVGYSIDGGSNWFMLGNLYDATNWYNDTNYLGMPVWGGQSPGSGYITAIHQLNGLAGQPSVKLRVYFIADAFVNMEGFAFDNVKIYESAALFGSCPDVNIEGTVGAPLNLFIKGGLPPYFVEWTPAAGLSCANCQVPIATPTQTTTYTAKIWDSKIGKAADTTYATATVFVYPELSVAANYDATVCDTAFTQIYAHVTGGVAPYTFVWDNVSTLSDGSIYNPVATPTVTTTYTVTVTDNLGFVDIDNVTITTVSGYTVVDIHPNGGNVCQGDGIQLTATGGSTYSWTAFPPSQIATISNPNIANPVVTPTVSGAKYTCTVSSTCGSASDFAIINILPRPTVTLAPFVPAVYCVYDAPFTLTGGLPAGGTYSGPGVNDGIFDPGLAGNGLHTITYTYVAPNGCPSTASRTITVRPRPNPFLSFSPAGYCIDHAPVTLTGGSNPLGGTYSGPGVVAGVFTPSVAGVGDHTITYSVVDAFGCTNEVTATLSVYALPVVTIDPIDAVCLNGGYVMLTGGLPLGGVYSGAGVTGTNFDPMMAGVGVHTITYTYTDLNGCTSSASTTIEVLPLPEVTGTVSAAWLCEGESVSYNLDLVGTGPWTIDWTLDGIPQTPWVASATPFVITFNPADTTEYTITGVSDATGCSNSVGLSWIIFVNPNPLAFNVVMNDPDGRYCDNTGGIAVGLNGSEVGVTYELFRDGVSTGLTFAGWGSDFWFVPNQTLPGVYTVVATADATPTNCQTDMTGFVTIGVDYLNVDMYPEFNEICLNGTTVIDAVITNPQISTGPYTFNWSPLADLSPNGYGSVLANPLVSKYIYLTVTDPTGCTAIDSVYITVNNPPVVTINGGVAEINQCDGIPVTLATSVVHGSGSSVVSYNWSPTTGLDLTNPAAPVALPTVPTTYNVTVTDNNGCEGYAQISVMLRPSPDVTFVGPNTGGICPGGSLTIPLQVPVIGSGSYSYAWAPGAGLSATNVRQPIATPTASTTYTVTITDVISGCYRIGTYTVNVNTPPTVSLGTTYNICNGSTANLFANVTGGTPGYNFVWGASPAVVSPAVIPATQNPSVVPQSNQNTTFTVTVTDAYGCTATSSVVITTVNTPVAHAGENDTICEGSSTMLTASGGGSYQWFIAGGAPITGVSAYPSVIVNPSVTTTYEVRVTSACGAAISTVQVVVNPATALDIAIPQTTFCQNDASVTVIGSPVNGTFSGTGITDLGNGLATFNPTVAGTYDITYTFVNQYGCEYTETVSVTVNALPVVTTFANAEACISDAAYALSGGLPVGGVYSGNGVAGGVFTAANAGVGVHTITYSYTDGNNCTASATSTITVNPLPEIFTVSVDNGGHYCAYTPAPGVHIYLSGSQPYMSGVTYRLILDGTFTGIQYPGTGYPIDFGAQTATGTYTVEAIYNASSCTQMMTGSATVVIDPLPLVYTVTGGGSYCSNGQGQTGSGVVVGIDNSNFGVTYHLYRNGSFTGVTAPGINGPLDFPAQSLGGTYTVVAVNDGTGCQIDMNGSATIEVITLPFKFFVAFNGGSPTLTVCPGTSVTIRQNASAPNVVYELYYNGVPTGQTRTYLNGPSLTWVSNSFAAGVYTVVATTQNDPHYCWNVMNGSATLSYYTVPSIVNNPGHQYIDEGQSATFTGLGDGSGISYSWFESTDDGATWNPLADGGIYSGTQTNTLYLSTCDYSMTRNQYRLRVSGNCGTVYSEAGILYIDPVISVYAGNVTSCQSNSILVPIYFTNADSINAISLTVEYDNANFSYAGYTNLNPSLNQFQLSVFATGNRIGISYFDVTNPINTNHGTFDFIQLRFNGSTTDGCRDINFDLSSQGACELSKISGEVLTSNFNNGEVCVVVPPVIVTAYQSPAGVCANGTVSLYAEATHVEGVSYSWTGPMGFTSNEQNPMIYNAQVGNAGTYTLTVTSLVNQCVATTTVNVVVWPNPAVYTVILPNGNSACAGSGVEVAMTGSEMNTTYQLYLNGVAIAAPDGVAAGTGGPITFGPQPVSGNYTVLATNQYGCTTWMDGNPHISINPLPLWFYVQGGGHYCVGGNGKEIRLSGSQIGVQYTLLLNACCCQADSIIATVNGTGSPLSFGLMTIPGYYSVVALNPNTGCGNNMIGCIPIIIDPLPTAVIGGGGSVCYGGCVNINFQMTGKAPYSIVVNNGSTNFTVTAPTANYTYSVCPTATTTYTIVSVTDANGCTNTGTGSAVATIWPLPVVSASNTSPVCEGGIATLSATATGNGPFTFTWTGPAGFNATGETATTTVAGVYTVQAIDANGCMNTAQTTVVVNPLPVVTATGSSACIGGYLYLEAYATGAMPITYAWTGPSGFTATGAMVSLNPATTAMAGTYTVIATDANGCVSVPATAELVVWDLPVISAASNSPVCVGNTLTLSASATGYGVLNYTWTGPNGFSASGATVSISSATMADAGDYTVTVVDEHQCSNTAVTTVVVNPLPEVCQVTGGGVYCFGCIPPTINIDCNTQIGVNYELYRDGIATGIIVAGTGSPINFGGVEIPGLYTVRATFVATGCYVWMYGSATVIEQAPPTATLTGDVVCIGESAELNIHLTGDSYWTLQISNGTTTSTVFVNSGVTGVTSYDYTYVVNPTVTTTYTVTLVTDAVCYNVGNSATVVVNPKPIRYTVTGGGYYCNGIGVYVGLNASQVGVSYQLYKGMPPVAVGAPVAGTGLPITFGPQDAGTYTVVGTYTATGCTNTMIGEAVVIPDPGTNDYLVFGGGHYCAGGSGVCVYLYGSQAGIEYKLLLNNIFTGQSIVGNGSPVSFCNVTAAGVYTVLAFNPQTSCTRTMSGSATVVVDPLPTALLSGGATVCYGQSATLHVALTGTAPWTFIINDGFTSVVHHTSVNSWDTIVTPVSTRTYTLTTVTDANCQNSGSGSAVVVVNSPNAYLVTGGGTYCAGGQGVIVGLSGSSVGVDYTLYNGVTAIATLAGTGAPLNFGYQTAAGTYTVVAHDNATTCDRTMNGTAVVVISPLPTEFNVTGGGACCMGCTHVFVCLDGSQYGVAYEIYINGVASGIVKYGNGQPFCFDYSTVGGTYTVRATNMTTGCWTWMLGSAEVIIYPTASGNISGNSTICAGDSALVTVNFTTGTAPFSFGLSNGASTTTYYNIPTSSYSFYVHPIVTTVYSLAWVSDVYGCYNNQNPGNAVVSVTQLPGVTVPQYPAVCIDMPAFALYGGLPAGGEYSGNGVVGGMFYPAVAGVGTHSILYTYTNGIGCVGFAYSSITVNPLPQPEFYGLGQEYCVDAQPVLLTGNYAPMGYFTGMGVIDNGNGTAYFNPGLAGVGGPYTITYSYTDANGCSASVSHSTGVGAVPVVYFTGLATTYCVNDGIVTLTPNMAGGTFSGPGIVGNTFNPAAAGVGGPYLISYTYSNGLCANTYNQYVSVLPAPTPCEFYSPNPNCCTGCFVDLILMCSETNVSYQLYKYYQGTTIPQLVQGVVQGTGQALVWTVADSGYYWVEATNLATGCTAPMNGSVTVITREWPEFTVTVNPSVVCTGQAATIDIALTGVAPFSFTIFDGVNLTQVMNHMTTSYQYVVAPASTQTYTFSNLTDFYCFNPGSEDATVIVNPAPALFNVTGGGATCQFGAGVEVGLDGSEAGVYYELFVDGNASGIVVVGTGAPISFGSFSVAGTYSVQSLSITTCEFMMNGSVDITVTPLPTVTLAPFANVCEGSAAFALSGGYPAGGVYSVNGFDTPVFDPTVMGVGTFYVTYTYTDQNGCSNSAQEMITVFAAPMVSIAPIASVCFDAPVFTLTGGYPMGGTYYVNGAVATEFDPAMYGAGTYDVTYMYEDVNGCSGSAATTVTVNALPNVSLAQFGVVCQNADPIVLTGGIPAGGVYSGQFITNGVFTPSTVGTYQITYTYTDANGCTSYAVQDITVEVCAQYAIAGVVTYDNAASTILNNVTVTLRQGSVVVGTDVTDANGAYEFAGLTPGAYTLTASSTKPWGGVNSADALVVLKHFANIAPLSGIRLLAANVNADAAVNSIDALLIAKRFVNQITSFPAGDWAFPTTNVNVVSANVTADFEGLCFGDVNGTYTPPFVKNPATVNLNTAGVKAIRSNESFELPINVNADLKVGAISLVVFYPEALVDVEGVTVNNANSNNVLFTAVNGELRISWYNTKGMIVSDKETLLTLSLKSKNISGVSAGELALTLDGVSDIADVNAMTIQNVNLTYPKLVVASNEYSISNFPNPFRNVTEISYNLPESGVVSLTVFNLLGETVSVLVNNVEQNAGTYKVEFDGANLVPGIYTYKIEVSGTSKDFVKTERMILAR